MEMDENQEGTAQPKSTSPLLVVGIIVVIAVIAGAFWLTSNQSKSTEATQITQTQTTVTEEPTAAVTESTVDQGMVKAIAVAGGDFYFKPNEIKVKKGEKVTITLTNEGKMKHDFVLDEFNVKSEQTNGGTTTTVEFTADKAGTFEFYCSVGTHRQLGMKGNLIVE
jgi:nitrite reductase (NO-forming)